MNRFNFFPCNKTTIKANELAIDFGATVFYVIKPSSLNSILYCSALMFLFL